MCDKSCPVERELDGIYYRVKRNDKYFNLCFSDLIEEEQQEILNRLDINGLHRMCKLLAGALRMIGDQLDLFRSDEFEGCNDEEKD